MYGCVCIYLSHIMAFTPNKKKSYHMILRVLIDDIPSLGFSLCNITRTSKYLLTCRLISLCRFRNPFCVRGNDLNHNLITKLMSQ